jgi:hypothetical protein
MTTTGPPATLVGAQGVYANVTQVSATPAYKITVEFGGPNFNGVDVPTLNFGPVGTTAPVVAALSEIVAGNSGTLDTNGQGGCTPFFGNGSLTTAGDVDKLGNISASNNPGGVNNVGPGPSFGGSTVPADTVLRTGPLTVTVAAVRGQGVAGGWTATDGIPADSTELGVGGSTGVVQPAIGPSGGKANLFGSPVNGLASGHAVDVTVNLATQISIERQVDGGFPAPNGKPSETLGNVNAYANCRQAWSGAIQDYLTNIHLVGNLKISPAVTADGHLRIARAYLKSQHPAEEALAACLSPYQLFLRGNGFTSDGAYTPTTGFPGSLAPNANIGPNLFAANTNGADASGFNPLAVLLGSGLPAAPPGITPSPSAAPTAGCDASSGPLNRAPFNVSPLAPGLPNLADKLAAGAAVAVRGELTVNNLNAEVLVGDVVGG